MQQKNCLVCGRLFQKPVNESQVVWDTRRKYCSKECADAAPRSEATREKQRRAKLGKPSWNKGIPLTGAHRAALRKKKPMSEAGKQAHRDSYRVGGKRPWNKIGDGITPLNERIRKSPEYKEWRRKVFERDDYTCKLCGENRGEINADHIKPFWSHPEHRFDVSNGRTLCILCHRKTETYGSHEYSQTVRTGLPGSVAKAFS